MRKLKKSQIEIMTLTINSFNVNAKDEKLPASISYWLNRNSINVQRKMKLFEDERQALLDAHAKRDSENKPMFEVKTDPDSKEQYPELQVKDQGAFEKAAAELLNEEVEVDLYELVNVEEKISNWTATQNIMDELWYLIDIINNYGNN